LSDGPRHGERGKRRVEYLRKEGRRHIIGTPKSQLRRYERELLSKEWKQVHEGLQVRLCPAPDGKEVFILCRSLEQQAIEQAMHDRFERRIEEGLEKISAVCRKRKQKPLVIAERMRKLMGQNTQASGLFRVQITEKAGTAHIEWSKLDAWRE
jgi:hypothetical protein